MTNTHFPESGTVTLQVQNKNLILKQKLKFGGQEAPYLVTSRWYCKNGMW